MDRAREFPAEAALTGWLFLALLGVGAFGGLVLLGVRRSLWSLAGAALMLGAAGYALQGRPELAGAPVQAAGKRGTVDPDLARLRLDMFGRFTYAEPYFAMSDAMIRAGADRSAVAALLGGLNTAGENPALWTALGQAYVAHDGGLSPAARFAFGRALQIAPEHPAPPLFYGIALVNEGRWIEARRWWSRAYRLSPQNAAYREWIASRLVMLDEAIRQQDGESRHQP